MEAARAFAQAAEGAPPEEALELRRRQAALLLNAGRFAEGEEVMAGVLAGIGMRLPASAGGAVVGMLAGRARLWLRGRGYTERPEGECAPFELTRLDACAGVAELLGVFHERTGEMVRLGSLTWTGRLGELVRRLEQFVRSADARGSLRLHQHVRGPSRRLRVAVRRRSRRRARAVRAAAGRWTARTYHNQHYWSFFAEAQAWSSSTGGALLDTERGASTSTLSLAPQLLALDEALVPWIFWSFCCELVPSLQQAPGGSNLVASTASLLVQPYPLAVAGTPQQLTIDPTAGTLSFTWSTAPVGGGSFAKGTVTSFEMPAASYPNGYTASATGGWITSPPCAPLLTVAAQPGTATVTVDVQPGGSCP